MKLHFLTLAALAVSACAATPNLRVPSSAETGPDALGLALFREGENEFLTEIEERRPLISHEKHLPVLSLQGHPTDYVVVLIHGMYESPFNLKSLRRNFEARGYNVWCPLLAKHWATPLQLLDKADFHEWLDDILADVTRAHKLGKKVLLAGHSTGGLLALYLAIQHPELVDGLVLWSPALSLTYETYYGALAGTLADGWVDINYNKLAGKPPPDPENVAYYSPYAGREVVRMEQALLLEYELTHAFMSRPYWSVKRSMYAAVKVPVLMFNPEVDEVIYRPEIELFWDSLAGPKVRYDLAGEDHTSTPKGPDDFYPGAQNPNKDFPGLLEKLNRFLDEQFPAGK